MIIHCLALADGASKQLSFSITINFFQNVFHFTINSLNSCSLMLLLVIESNKLHRRFLQSNLIFVCQVIGCDVSITVAVFDYVHWKLPIASFLLKWLFSFFKRRGSVRPRNILFTISTYASYQYFSNQVTTSRQLIRSWTQMHSIKPQSHRACDHVTTYVRPQNKTNRR